MSSENTSLVSFFTDQKFFFKKKQTDVGESSSSVLFLMVKISDFTSDKNKFCKM